MGCLAQSHVDEIKQLNSLPPVGTTFSGGQVDDEHHCQTFHWRCIFTQSRLEVSAEATSCAEDPEGRCTLLVMILVLNIILSMIVSWRMFCKYLSAMSCQLSVICSWTALKLSNSSHSVTKCTPDHCDVTEGPRARTTTSSSCCRNLKVFSCSCFAKCHSLNHRSGFSFLNNWSCKAAQLV